MELLLQNKFPNSSFQGRQLRVALAGVKECNRLGFRSKNILTTSAINPSQEISQQKMGQKVLGDGD